MRRRLLLLIAAVPAIVFGNTLLQKTKVTRYEPAEEELQSVFGQIEWQTDSLDSDVDIDWQSSAKSEPASSSSSNNPKWFDTYCKQCEKRILKQVQQWANKASSQLAQQKARIDKQDRVIAQLVATVASLQSQITSPSASPAPPSPSPSPSPSTTPSRLASRSRSPSPSRSPPPYPSPPATDGAVNSTYVGNIIITGTQDLSQLQWLRYIARVEGNVAITDSDVQEFDLFDSLQEITGNLVIQLNQHLRSVGGLFRLRRVGGDVFVWKNSELKYLDGLQSLEVIDGSLQIRSNSKLEDVSALVSLQTVGGNVVISKSDMLSEVSGFESLVSVGGNVVISRNDMLSQLSGFESLVSVGGGLEITSNAGLTKIELKPYAEDWEIQGSLTINLNAMLSEVSITAIRTGDLSIDNEAQLLRIEFENLQQANGISITNLDQIQSIRLPNLRNCYSLDLATNSFASFELYAPSLEVVSSLLRISDNVGLTSVVMLSLTRVHTIYIEYNFSLTSLDFLSSLAQSGVDVPGGSANVEYITISKNGVNCVNWMYVLYSC